VAGAGDILVGAGSARGPLTQMRRIFCYSAVIVATLLLGGTGRPANAQGKSGNSNAGGEAASHMSDKGLENNNAQWSAGATKGLQRAEERRALHGKNPSKSSEKKSGSSKGKGKQGY
jgi:hypothetical protein